METSDYTIEGNIVDIINRNIFSGKIYVSGGRIERIECRKDLLKDIYTVSCIVLL